MTTKQIGMRVFAGSGFDCEYELMHCGFDGNGTYICWDVGELTAITKTNFIFDKSACCSDKCRPRLNKAQVLDSWSWVPDGLVWVVGFTEDFDMGVTTKLNHLTASSKELRDMELALVNIIHCECIGVEANAGYDKWAKEHDMELIEL